jgi:hypothetical protein
VTGTQYCQSAGACPHAGSGIHPSGGYQPSGGVGQFGGGLKRYSTKTPRSHCLRPEPKDNLAAHADDRDLWLRPRAPGRGRTPTDQRSPAASSLHSVLRSWSPPGMLVER